MSELLSEVFVARQPLVDADLTVPAYEILYRDVHGLAPVGAAAGERATARVLIDVLLGAHGAIVPAGHDAYVNVPASMLEADLLLDLPPTELVLEVLEDASDTPGLRAAITRHRDAGFRVALDDVVPGDARLAMVELTDAVKVDVLASGLQPSLALIAQLAGEGHLVVAEKVEDERTRQLVLSVGARLVQGFVFSRPELVGTVRPHGIDATHLELLDQVAREEADLEVVDQLIRSNVTLADRFLRLADIATGWRRIGSVRDGLLMIGQRAVHRWVLLLVLSAMAEDSPGELLTIGSVRARFCESLQHHLDADRRLEGFVLGMFSILGPAGVVGEELLGDLPVAGAVRGALRGEAGELRELLETSLAAEAADWDTAVTRGARLGLTAAQISAAHIEALRWSASIKDATGGGSASARPTM